MRQLSTKTDNKIKAFGLLGKMKQMTYDILYEHSRAIPDEGIKGLTANELQHYARQMYEIENTSSLQKRLSELYQMGCIDKIGSRTCRISKITCTEWSVNGSMPAKAESAQSAEDKKKSALSLYDKLMTDYCKQDKGWVFDPRWLELKSLIKMI